MKRRSVKPHPQPPPMDPGLVFKFNVPLPAVWCWALGCDRAIDVENGIAYIAPKDLSKTARMVLGCALLDMVVNSGDYETAAIMKVELRKAWPGHFQQSLTPLLDPEKFRFEVPVTA
ncbi:MAG: hypothetical protein AB9869_26000 [Verrucomicrobiia bacterium]